MSSEDRYEHIDLIVKCRDDGENWFDIIGDYISQDCQGTPYDEETGVEGDPCTCGMESMAGCVGTLQQCYDYGTTVGGGLQPIDLANVISVFAEELGGQNAVGPQWDEKILKVVEWAKNEIEFEERWANWTPSEEDEDEGEDFRELTIDQEEG